MDNIAHSPSHLMILMFRVILGFYNLVLCLDTVFDYRRKMVNFSVAWVSSTKMPALKSKNVSIFI